MISTGRRPFSHLYCTFSQSFATRVTARPVGDAHESKQATRKTHICAFCAKVSIIFQLSSVWLNIPRVLNPLIKSHLSPSTLCFPVQYVSLGTFQLVHPPPCAPVMHTERLQSARSRRQPRTHTLLSKTFISLLISLQPRNLSLPRSAGLHQAIRSVLRRERVGSAGRGATLPARRGRAVVRLIGYRSYLI